MIRGGRLSSPWVRAGALLTSVGLLAPVAVAAQERAPQGLQLAFAGECSRIDRAQVRRIASIELRARLVSGRPDAPLPPVTVTCGDDAAMVRTAGAAGAPARERAVPLAGTATIARARLLALAITELVLSPELPPDPAPAPAPSPPSPPPQVAAAPAPRAPIGLFALGYGRSWPSGWASAGAGVAVSGWFARRGLLRLDALYDHGSAVVMEGTAVVDSVSLGAAALLGARPAGWQIGVGAGARLGGTRLAGRAADPTMARGKAFLAASGGPMAVLLVAPPPLFRIAFQLSFEWGRVTMPVNGRAGNVRTFAVEGSWLGAALGAGFTL